MSVPKFPISEERQIELKNLHIVKEEYEVDVENNKKRLLWCINEEGRKKVIPQEEFRYNIWQPYAFAFTSGELGSKEESLEIFLTFSQLSGEYYDEREAVEKFEDAYRRRNGKKNIASVFELFKRYGILYKEAYIEEKQKNLESDSDLYEMTWEFKPAYVKPCLTFQDENILEEGNISGLASGAGNGKSQTLEAIISSFLNPECDSFKFKTHLPEGKLLVVFDGERSKKHTRATLGRMHKRIGLSTHWEILDPEKVEVKNGYWELTNPDELKSIRRYPDLKFYCLNLIPTPREKFKRICETIEQLKDKIGLLILDGFGEITTETNSETESIELYSKLKAYANRYGFGVFGTIHTNPKDNKPRGWIGSEAWRVMQCLLLLSKAPNDPNVRVITSEFEFGKNRDGADNMSCAFSWDYDKKMMSSVEYEKKKKGLDQKLRTAFTRIFLDQYTTSGKEEFSQQDLKDLYMKHGYAETDSAAQNHIKRAVEDFTILTERQEGKFKFYSLIKR